jgi:hypothetical protein
MAGFAVTGLRREKLTLRCSAELSECGRYRYSLSRIWDRRKGAGLFVLLNPSTATAHFSDQTMGNCNNLAVHWGWGGFYIGNLYAFRATNPQELHAQDDPVGPLNDAVLRRLARRAECVVLAWGNGHRARAATVKRLLGDYTLFCLRENRGGGYQHPARIRAEDYPAPRRIRRSV